MRVHLLRSKQIMISKATWMLGHARQCGMRMKHAIWPSLNTKVVIFWYNCYFEVKFDR